MIYDKIVFYSLLKEMLFVDLFTPLRTSYAVSIVVINWVITAPRCIIPRNKTSRDNGIAVKYYYSCRVWGEM